MIIYIAKISVTPGLYLQGVFFFCMICAEVSLSPSFTVSVGENISLLLHWWMVCFVQFIGKFQCKLADNFSFAFLDTWPQAVRLDTLEQGWFIMHIILIKNKYDFYA